jgi:LmbE family N-acetylglucosaminyl deacetylase
MSNNKKIALVIAPHQDDETIGCGGTICRLLDDGYEVKVAHVFLGTSGVASVTPEKGAGIRHGEALEAAKIGGYEVLENLGFVDRDRKNDHLIQPRIIKLIRSVKPTIVFAPHTGETDLEHHLVSIAVKEAIWLSVADIFTELGRPLRAIPRGLYYEVWKSIDSPIVLSDISNYVQKKSEMLNAFESQMSQTSWVDGSVGHSAYRATTTLGAGNVEVFEGSGILIEEII